MTTATSASSSAAPVIHPAITDLFHRISRVLPDDQEILTLAPQSKALEAIRLLKLGNYAQAPVLESGTVVGIFSFRSFAVELAAQNPDKVKLAVMLVEECMEAVGPDHFRSLFGEFPPLLDLLDNQDAVLIGEPERLQGIVTAMDVLRYLYGVASPFVLLTEIEKAIRELMIHSADDNVLSTCAHASLKNKYKDRPIPTKPVDMTFDDYGSVIGNDNNWPIFADAFGGSRGRTRAKLDEIRVLRNVVFHCRRELEPSEHAALRMHREWILLRSRVVEARKSKEASHV